MDAGVGRHRSAGAGDEAPHSAAQREDEGFFGGLRSTHTNRRDKEDHDVTVSLLRHLQDSFLSVASDSPASSPSGAPVLVPSHAIVPSTLEGPTLMDEISEYAVFTAALDLAGIGDLLRDPAADLTVFAPRDSAFQQEYWAYMSWNWVAHLANLLSLHIANGQVGSSDLVNGLAMKSYNGEFIQISANATSISVSSSAGVNGFIVQPDIFSSNGVAHGIDCVLTPAFFFKVVSNLSSTYATFIQLLEITNLK
jgi:uncharacterized surface protein with fasciclin (FAS1) repeats